MPNSYMQSIKDVIGSLLARPAEDGDAIQMLMADHRRVDQLLKEFEGAEEPEKKSICTKILLELTVHAKVEEEFVYPLLKQEGEGEKDLVDEALIEHECVKYLIGELEGAGPGSDKFDAKVKVLGELVKHHVKEEENEMFPKLRASDNDMNELAQRLAKRKEELLQALQKKPSLSTNGKASPSRGRNGSSNGKTSSAPATKRKPASKSTSKRATSTRGKVTAKKATGKAKAASGRATSKITTKSSAAKSKAASSRGKATSKATSRTSSTAKKPAATKKGAASKAGSSTSASKGKSRASKARSKSR